MYWMLSEFLYIPYAKQFIRTLHECKLNLNSLSVTNDHWDCFTENEHLQKKT